MRALLYFLGPALLGTDPLGTQGVPLGSQGSPWGPIWDPSEAQRSIPGGPLGTHHTGHTQKSQGGPGTHGPLYFFGFASLSRIGMFFLILRNLMPSLNKSIVLCSNITTVSCIHLCNSNMNHRGISNLIVIMAPQ